MNDIVTSRSRGQPAKKACKHCASCSVFNGDLVLEQRQVYCVGFTRSFTGNTGFPLLDRLFVSTACAGLMASRTLRELVLDVYGWSLRGQIRWRSRMQSMALSLLPGQGSQSVGLKVGRSDTLRERRVLCNVKQRLEALLVVYKRDLVKQMI